MIAVSRSETCPGSAKPPWGIFEEDKVYTQALLDQQVATRIAGLHAVDQGDFTCPRSESHQLPCITRKAGLTAVGTMYRSIPVQLLRFFSIAYVNALISQFILLATCN